MSKELVISANRHETRVAIVEDEQVVEIYHQRENEYSLAGSIHKGRVTRVLPGMQSAFVDIGLERDAFLYVSDFFEDNEEYDKIVTSVEEKVLKLDRSPVPAAAIPPQLTQQPAEGPPAVEAGAEEAEPVAAAPARIPAVVPSGQPPMQPREQRDPREARGDRGGDHGGDRGGRRGRRRRGGRPERGGERGGRGLPESKFYSPRQGEEPAARPVSEERGEAAPASAEADDFFVLPGESLAKYTGPPLDEPAGYDEPEALFESSDEAPSGDEEALEHPGEVPSEAAAATPAELAGETRDEIAAEPPSEPMPELSVVAVEVIEETAAEAPATTHAAVEVDEAPETAEDVEPLPADPVEPVDTTEHLTPVEVAEEIAEVGDAAEPGESPETAEEIEAREVAEALEEALDAVEAADAESESAEPGEGAEIVEPEGPEPARIPTSLTATLREQGPRFLHRVSRRTRRRGGREGREGRDDRGNRQEVRPDGRQQGPPAEGGAGDSPARVGRSQDQRQDARPEPRQEQRPDPRQDQRQEPRQVQGRGSEGRPEKSALPSISDLLREGQEIIVQIAKEPLGQKGARITSHIALPGRFLVYMPTVDHIGVSRKIPSDDERLRLKRVLQNNRTGIPGGYIVRTAGDGHTEEELRADMMFLYNLWLDMRQKAERKPAPMLIHHDLNVVERVLRDQLTTSFKSIWVDNEEEYENVLRFVQRFQPALVNRVKLYTRSNPIFDEFNITSELEKALRPKVWLKSGGYIVINQTEALVAIDINTGKFVGKSNRLEDTIVKTNTDAIKEIVRQIRLRDLGGIIVVDFIDMDERKNRQKVMQALEEAMRSDRAPYKILQFNDFGLVAITRKRVKQSLERTLCTPCPYCEGAGYVKSPQTVVGEILQEAQKIARAVEGKDVMLRVGPDVAKLLKSNQNSFLQEIEEILGRTVIVKSDHQLHQEKFDLA